VLYKQILKLCKRDFEVMTNFLENINFVSMHSPPTINLKKARETAEDFEAFFIARMMESMFEGVNPNGLTGGGHAEKIYRSLLLNEYGKTVAKTGGIGVSDIIMDAIIQMQEAQSSKETRS
jgi:Rod binding domain-containing protein